VISVKGGLEGTCSHGQGRFTTEHLSADRKVDETFEINTHRTGGICGYCYHDLFPTLMTLCMGGKIPWFESGDEFTYECPDRYNLVTFRRTGEE